MLPLTLVFSAIFFLSWWWLLKRRNALMTFEPTAPGDADNILLVTAHPDDELMFFGPTLLNELRIRARARARRKSAETTEFQAAANTQVHLLCLSTGDYYGDGSDRRFELAQACEYLLKSSYHSDPESIPAERLALLDDLFRWTVLDDPKLKDSPETAWPADHILSLVEQYCHQNGITKVITFDRWGISGHPNHRSVYEALRQCSSVPVWTLQTVPLVRKYLAAFDIVWTMIWWWWRCHGGAIYLVSSLKDYLNLVRSLRQHRSQMVWFRYLYQATSRYMFINTLIIAK